MSASTILLVDDDEVLSQVLRRVLTRDGYNVVEAGNVEQALQQAREHPPSLALVDLRLPDGDGVDLARQLEKQVGRFPLILMTAYPLRLRDQPELAKGFAHVLTKPLNLDELRQAIEASLGATGRTHETAPDKPPVETAGETAPVRQPEPVPADAALPRPRQTPAPRRHLRWAVLAGVIVAVAGLAAALPALGMPGIPNWLKPSAGRLVAPSLESRAQLVPGTEEAIELPREVVDRLGVTSEPVSEAVAPRTLELAGSLSFDPNHLGRVQARFAGEVIELGTHEERGADGRTHKRTLRYGDPVTKGQILAVVLSKDLGEKKSELVDALVHLWYDEANLKSLETLAEEGRTPAVTVRTQRTAVAMDHNAASKAELTLRTWRVPDEEIEAVKKEALRVFESQGKRDLKKETEWAKVEVRAPFDGTIVEKNVALRSIVDTSFVLYQVADLRKLGVLVHAYEEDLRVLQNVLRQQPQGYYPWEVRTGADLKRRRLKSEGLQQIGLVVDPTQHTDPVMGLVDNSSGDLRVGQFVTATVNLPAPPNVVALPASALNENGAESVIFVQPDPSKTRYVLRRVSVALRLRDIVYIRSQLTEEDRKKGLQEVRPNEYIVTEGVLELKSALEDLQAKAKAQK
jgi:cobalt-zinc-cadmium efflux system membrane fusion protein